MGVECPKCNTENTSDSEFCKKCATPLPSSEEISAVPTKALKTPIKELTRGSTFAGRYEVIEELGEGGMGKVYRIEDKKIKEEIALKLINPEIASDKKTIERFSNELKFARKIAHRNVCRMYDLGEAGRTHYITMEYVHGENLKGMIRMMGQLSPRQAISIAKHVCEGLAEAHRLGVVHRDLKSSNIMVDKDGNARIMDFGIARSLQAKGITGAGVMIGTPEYTSPEQVKGKEIDQRSDIYSLGIILYEMMTGRVPFEGDSVLSIALKQETEIPADPRQLNAQITEDLSHVILKCLEKDRENRYQSVGEVSSELSRIEKGFPVTERDIPKIKPDVEKVGKFKWKSSLLYGSAVVLLILLIIVGHSLFTGNREAIDSIAVLPLENLSGNPEQEYFADGMTEALISELTKMSALRRVISRTSVMQYKGAPKSMPEIAQELNVDTVVEGSVLLVGEKVRITVQLIEAEADKFLWADSYERDLSNILELQRELARTVVQEINIVLTPEEATRLKRSPQVNPESYHLYLKGRFFWNKRTEADLRKAIEFFKEAIIKDPNYALAYVGLADSYITLPDYSSFTPEEANSKAKELITKALELDNKLAEAHNTLAVVLSESLNWEEAEREFQRAIELNPGHATAHHWYALHLMYMARFDEAIEEIKRALELDPLSLVINRNVGQVCFFARQYDDAIEALKKTIEMDPNFPYAHFFLGAAYSQKSMYEESLAEFQKESNIAWTAITYVRMGKRGEAQNMLEELLVQSKKEYVSPFNIAVVYFVLGENDQGFKWLEKAYEEGIGERLLKISPALDNVRSDPRYKTLLKKVGLDK